MINTNAMRKRARRCRLLALQAEPNIRTELYALAELFDDEARRAETRHAAERVHGAPSRASPARCLRPSRSLLQAKMP